MPATAKRRRRGAGANPLRVDPTRTAGLRRRFIAEIKRRFSGLKAAILKLVGGDDEFGLSEQSHDPFSTNAEKGGANCGTGAGGFKPGNTCANDRWRFNSDPETIATANARAWRFHSDPAKVRAFQDWLKTQTRLRIYRNDEDALWRAYIEAGFKQGAGRAFDDARRSVRQKHAGQQRLDFYEGTKDEFLRSAFGQPVAVEKVKLLAGRSFDDLKNVTEDMSARLSRRLVDGLIQGKGARELARDLADDVGISQQRAALIARTEIIRAHAEGQLAALELMGVEEVGVMVEWATAGDAHVCPLCRPMEGVVLKIAEAHGMIPRHPNCRCAFIPANVGESTRGQIRTKRGVIGAISRSAELGGDDFDAATGISAARPTSILNAANVLLGPQVSRELIEFSALMRNAEKPAGSNSDNNQTRSERWEPMQEQ